MSERESVEDYIARLEKDEQLDPSCKTCQDYFYPLIKSAKLEANITNIYAPRHKASNNCKSGRHNHCSCDVCF